MSGTFIYQQYVPIWNMFIAAVGNPTSETLLVSVSITFFVFLCRRFSWWSSGYGELSVPQLRFKVPNSTTCPAQEQAAQHNKKQAFHVDACSAVPTQAIRNNLSCSFLSPTLLRNDLCFLVFHTILSKDAVRERCKIMYSIWPKYSDVTVEWHTRTSFFPQQIIFPNHSTVWELKRSKNTSLKKKIVSFWLGYCSVMFRFNKMFYTNNFILISNSA